MSNDMRKLIDKFNLNEIEEKSTSVVTPPTTSKNEMDQGNNFFNQEKYYDAYKQYKLAQQKEPNYFWAYYNAAASAFNARTRQSLQLISNEIDMSNRLLQNWAGGIKEKSAAKIRLDSLLRSIRNTTNLNI